MSRRGRRRTELDREIRNVTRPSHVADLSLSPALLEIEMALGDGGSCRSGDHRASHGITHDKKVRVSDIVPRDGETGIPPGNRKERIDPQNLTLPHPCSIPVHM